MILWNSMMKLESYQGDYYTTGCLLDYVYFKTITN